MKFEFPPWAVAAVASAGIIAGSTYLAMRHQDKLPAFELTFPDAQPAPHGLAERAQKLYEAKEYTFKFFGPKHGPEQQCTDRAGRLLTDCPASCPETPDVFGEMAIDGKAYEFTTIADRVVELRNGTTRYDIYWWGAVNNLVRDGPYQYDHGRRQWGPAPRWWLPRKNQ